MIAGFHTRQTSSGDVDENHAVAKKKEEEECVELMRGERMQLETMRMNQLWQWWSGTGAIQDVDSC